MRRLVLATLPLLLSLACTVEQNQGAENAKAVPEVAAQEGEQDRPAAAEDRAQLLSNSLLDLSAVLGKSPEQAETVLGEAKTKGERESSCVRFVPERVFFKCKHDIRTYEHPQLTLLSVDYQDGRAAEVQLSGLPGTGAFSYDAVLGLVGLVLPGEPHHAQPGAMGAPAGTIVDTWDWSNSSARLLAEGRQFRVRVSVVNDQWKTSKIEFLDNTPLSEDEKTRIMAAKNPAGGQ